jgi:predicted dehydrogenase
MTYLSIGIVGTGAVARLHASALASIEGVRLASVWGPDPAKAALLVHGVAPAQSIDELLAAVDAVIVTSPSAAHAEQGRLVIAAGRAALVELPVAATAGEARSLARASAEAGVLASGTHTARWTAAAAHVRGLLAGDAIGTIRHIAIERRVATRRRSWTDDPLAHHAQHAVDLLRFWFGAVEAVGAVTGDASVTAVLRLPGGTAASLTVSHGTLGDLQRIVVVGADGSIDTDGFGSVRVSGRSGSQVVLDLPLESAYHEAIRCQDAEFVTGLRAGIRGAAGLAETIANLEVVDRLRALAHG